MSSIFTKIIQGDIPCHKIAENDDFIAFLDINPLSPGHTLVVPKKEVDVFFDLNDELLSRINPFAKRIAAAIEEHVSCQRIGVIVFGLEVPHAHMHLIPIRTGEDMSFAKEREKMSNAEMSELAEKISKSFRD